MPSLQGIDLGRDKPEPTGVQDFFSNLKNHYQQKEEQSEIGKLMDEYNKNRENKYAWENRNQALQRNNKISPSKRLELQKQFLDEKRLLIDEDKAINAKMPKTLNELQLAQKALADERLKSLRSNQQLIDTFNNQLQPEQNVQNDNFEDQLIENNPNEESNPNAENNPELQQLSTAPAIKPTQTPNIKNVPLETLLQLAAQKGQPSEAGIIGNMAQAEIDRRDKNQKLQQENRKETRDSFKTNEKFIDNTYNKYEDAERREAIFDRMDQLEDSGQLSESGVINLLESIGIQPEWLKNPANEEYTKLALDLLGGGTLQADYGSRVLASEFKVSQQRIPSLMQTMEGRKQIKENLRAMLLPSILKKERMDYYIEKSNRTGDPLPNDLRGQILRDIKPQLEEAYDKFKQRNGRYKVRKGTIPDEDVGEKYFFLANENEDNAIKLMREDGYDVD